MEFWARCFCRWLPECCGAQSILYNDWRIAIVKWVLKSLPRRNDGGYDYSWLFCEALCV